MTSRAMIIKRFLRGERALSRRIKVILIGMLLLLALGVTGFAATVTLQALQQFEQQKMLAATSDVSTIRPWMTVPYIARVYHVPEPFLYRSLHVDAAHPPRRANLRLLASRLNRPVDDVIRDLQLDIITYHRQHPSPPTPLAEDMNMGGNWGRMGR